MRQQMQERLSERSYRSLFLYQTSDAGLSLAENAGVTPSEALYDTEDAGLSLFKSGCRRHSFRQRI